MAIEHLSFFACVDNRGGLLDFVRNLRESQTHGCESPPPARFCRRVLSRLLTAVVHIAYLRDVIHSIFVTEFTSVERNHVAVLDIHLHIIGDSEVSLSRLTTAILFCP